MQKEVASQTSQIKKLFESLKKGERKKERKSLTVELAASLLDTCIPLQKAIVRVGQNTAAKENRVVIVVIGF